MSTARTRVDDDAERERVRALGRRLRAQWEAENGPFTEEEWAAAEERRRIREAQARGEK